MDRAKPTKTGRELRASAEIRRIVGRVRRRWRVKLLLRGLALTMAGALLTFLLSASSLEVLRFQPEAVTTFRVVLWLVVAGFLARWVAWPLLRPISDDRVALYLEEHEPSLKSGVLTAVETVRPGAPARTELLEAVVERAVERCRRIDHGKSIERSAIRRSSGALGGLALASFALVFLGPGFFRHASSALFFPARAAETVNPYSVSVSPGDTTISRNSDLVVSAVLRGFDSDDVVLFMREAGESGWSVMPMIATGTGAFDGLLLNVADETRYYVESSGVRSGTFTLGVADLPAVDRLAMEYRFPAYSGLAPRHFEYGGDVAALAGTTVVLTVTPTLSAPAARLVMDSGDTIPMSPLETPAAGVPAGEEDALQVASSFQGSFRLARPGFYGIEFRTAEGMWVAGAPDYRIDVLADQGPSISFSKPGRDTEVSSIEEVFIEARADDDIGVAEVLWIASVNGGPPDTVRIHGSTGAPMAEVTASHVVFMEELELETGDLVAYHGVARDNAPVPNEALTDIYFLQVRPFRRDFREAPAGGGGGGGGEGGGMEEDLSRLQRQIIAASFNLVRDRKSYAPEAWEENVISIALSQQRLREQVETLAQRIVNRGITGADESFQRIAETLPRAVEAMQEAEDSLRALAPDGAIGPEQRALRELQKAEETYERFVSMEQQQGGGGGGGGGSPSAEDLADLFELETDQLRNQYETVQQSRQQSADQAVDESLEKLRELARRQEQELERQRRRAAAQQGDATGAGGGEAARQLADEAEEAARRLERLSREAGDRSLEDVSRQLQQAADDMRRAAANRGSAGVAEAQSALRRLRDAREQLEDARDDRLERDVADARRQTAELQRQQRDVDNRLEAMRRAGSPSADQIGRINDVKASMAERTEEVLQKLDRAAAQARRDGRTGADELDEAAETIRDTQLRERLLYSRGLVGRPDQEEYAKAFENQTSQAIQSLQNRLDEAAEAISAPAGDDPREEALESARDLVRSLESMERRQGQGEGGEQGEQGQGSQDQGNQDRAGGQNQGGPAINGGARGSGPRGPVGPFDTDDVRRMRREVRERAGEARALAELMERAGADPSELEAMIAAMRALDRDRTYSDPEEVMRLRSELVDGMKQIEFRLRRELAAAGEEQLLMRPSGDVPEEYRALVEEYYRVLSRGVPRLR